LEAGRMKRDKIYRLLSHGALIFTSLLIIMPLLVMISSAFKNEMEIFDYPMKLIPNIMHLDNFVQLYKKFPLYIFNSFKVTFMIMTIQILTASAAAYAFSKITWKGREAIFLLYIGSVMIPVQVPIIPQFIIIRHLGLYDSHFALIVLGSFTAFGTFLLRQHFLTIPDSLLEEARINGASEFYIFSRIMLPLARPSLAVLAIFSFRYFWNDFFTPMIYLTTENLKTIPLGMSDFVTQYAIYYGPQMAACLISIIPVAAVFFAAQEFFVQGITGIKD